MLKVRSLSTYHNPLGLPEGSLLTANNIVIDRNDTARPRRGFSNYGDVTDGDQSIKTLINYKDRILRHVGGTLQFDSDAEDGTFTTFSGSYTEIESGLRIKSVEASGNLFFTTDDGIKKISGTISSGITNFTSQDKFIKDAGGPSALDVRGSLIFEDGAFLPPLSKTAYRVVWGSRDSNNNLVLGSPSSRTIIVNTDSDKSTHEVSTLDTTWASNSNGFIAATELEEKYFLFEDGDGTLFFVWFNLDNSSSVPSTSQTVGRIAIEANIVTGDGEATIASRIATALTSSTANVSTAIAGNIVTIANLSGGDVSDISDGAASTGILFATSIGGSSSVGKSSSVELMFNIPFDADTSDFFYQLYRTGIATATTEDGVNDLEPGDEMNLVFESNLTSDDLLASEITIKDETPDTFRQSGTLLYTNPVSGEGILQANEKPPMAKDVEIFQNSVFYANTQTKHSIQFNMLSAENFVSEQSKFIVGNSNIEKTYTFVGDTEKSTVTTTAFAAITDKSYILANSATNERKYFFWLDKIGDDVEPSDTDTEGRIAIRVSIVGAVTSDDVATILASSVDDQTDFTSSATGSDVTITNSKNGNADDTADGISATLFNFVTNIQGDGEQANTLEGGDVLKSSLVSAGQSIDETARSLVHIINSDTDTKEKTEISCSALLLGNDGESFLMTDSRDVNKIQFYYDTTGADATIPTPAVGYTLERVNVSADLTADGVATATESSMGSVLGGLSFNTTVSTNVVTVENVEDGPSEDSSDIDTGFTFTVTQHGTYESPVSAFYLSGVDDLPGIILLRSKNLSDPEFYIGVQDDVDDITKQFSPVMSEAKTITNIVDLVTTPDTVEVTSAAHGYATGSEVYLFNNDILGKYTILSATTNDFVIEATFISDTGGRAMLANRVSSNDVTPNRVFFSKSDKPEAVPLTNYIDVGGKDAPIERIVALRDNLFVLKTDGVYILTGTIAPNFSVRLLDNSVAIVAPDSAARLNNQIYMLSTQGVATVSDGGVGVISRRIEDRIFDVTGDGFSTRTAGFGIGYETDRSYLLWVPTKKEDTVATQVYRFNTFNQSWVRWTELDAISSVVNSSDDKIYLASGDSPYIRKERKGEGRKDHADSDGPLKVIVQPDGATDTQLELNSVSDIIEGDVLVQLQYVTVAKFNRTLRKLDSDAQMGNLPSGDGYNENLEMSIGSDLKLSLLALVIKVDLQDTSQGYSIPTGNTFEELRDDYNVLIDELNASIGVGYNNYKEVIDSTEFEAIILEKDSSSGVVTLEYPMPMMTGDITYFKGIISEIEWAPQHFGDPSILKQIAEGTVMFDGNNFVSAELGFSSDMSKDVTIKKFSGRGVGFWGGWVWGDNAWGGEGTDVPYRTLIPREKQRCRYMSVKFVHRNAREEFSVLGISLNVRPLSTRAYRGI